MYKNNRVSSIFYKIIDKLCIIIDKIIIKGAKEHNLKNINLEIGDKVLLEGTFSKPTENTTEYLFNYKDYLNTSFIVNNQKLKIVGFVKSDNSYYSSLNGILYQSSLFDRPITDVYIYPQNYHSKITIKENLKNVNIIDNAENTLSLLKNLIKTISIILILFSVISIIVSIFMIYIITFINTLERTKEIGLKKAIGAKKKAILFQFLTEAVVLTSIGGIVGVLTGIGLAKLISIFNSTPVSISIPAMILSVLFSMAIGIIFGLLPSYKAANLDPIEALRHE